MKQYRAPNGLRIMGIKESIPCVVLVNGWSSEGDEPIYAGKATLDWDAQHYITDENDERILVDEHGDDHPFSTCTLVDQL